MIRSTVTGLLALISVIAIGSFPIACQSGGVGDPCTPEDEYSANFAGFQVTEENIESRSFQCLTRICLVNHFQGRVSCPLGQSGVGDPPDPNIPQHLACNGPKDTTSCAAIPGAKCVPSESNAPDCDPTQPSASQCPGNTTCNPNTQICTCTQDYSAGDGGPDFFCVEGILRSYVCHKPGNCQTAGGTTKENEGKDCCLPGTDTPVTVSVCGQCSAAVQNPRDANDAVYCSCRCAVADGQPAEPNFNFCQCPTDYTCSEIRPNVGLGDAELTGKYCVKTNSIYTPSTDTATACGTVVGHFDSTCVGVGL